MASRYAVVVAASGVSFMLGFKYSDYFVRHGHTATSLVMNPSPNDLPAAGLPLQAKATVVETLPRPSRSSEIMKFGYPSYDSLRTFTDFIVSYDRRTRTANWVMEHLTPENFNYDENIERGKCTFRPDESIHPFFRSQNEDYRGSGYDRGHLAAAANHRRSQVAMDETFYLSNMSPQVGKGFNRDKWAELEKHVRRTARSNKNTYVLTGPLFLPHKEADGHKYVKYKVIGANNVAVPTHFFKTALVEVAPNKYELNSWILPNAPIPDATPLEQFLVPLDAVERAAGVLIYDRLPRQQLLMINGKKLGGGFFS